MAESLLSSILNAIENGMVSVGATDIQTFTIFIRTCPAKHEHGFSQNTEGVRKFLTLFTAPPNPVVIQIGEIPSAMAELLLIFNL